MISAYGFSLVIIFLQCQISLKFSTHLAPRTLHYAFKGLAAAILWCLHANWWEDREMSPVMTILWPPCPPAISLSLPSWLVDSWAMWWCAGEMARGLCRTMFNIMKCGVEKASQYSGMQAAATQAPRLLRQHMSAAAWVLMQLPRSWCLLPVALTLHERMRCIELQHPHKCDRNRLSYRQREAIRNG